jgi:hypothetical protein
MSKAEILTGRTQNYSIDIALAGMRALSVPVMKLSFLTRYSLPFLRITPENFPILTECYPS